MEKGVFLLSHNLKVPAPHPRKWRQHYELPCKSFSSYQEVLCLFLKAFQGKRGVKIAA